ncbi:peroxisomal membrane protein 11B [Ischnura elegans]|uniref:peroxisomal membrane protein 11B n=1 Tax=Ischnura elegans TaxID=197161 RepID=UPI001ED8BCAA|nr:peroxisomal membrane protein 11B [Ischnura elegans]
MDIIVSLNNQTAGRDKIVRLLQYGSKATWHYMQGRPLGSRSVEQLKNLEYTFGSFRRLLRLGRFLDSLYSALSTIHHADLVVRITLTLSKIASALFLLADHILWFGRAGLMVVDSSRWSTISYKYWLYSLTMNLVRDVYEIWRGLTRQVDKRSLRIGSPSRSYQCRIDSVCPVSAMKLILAFLSEHQDVAVDTVKNACDLLIPLTALGYTSFSPGAIGILGVVSSIAALMSLIDPTKKLSPS